MLILEHPIGCSLSRVIINFEIIYTVNNVTFSHEHFVACMNSLIAIVNIRIYQSLVHNVINFFLKEFSKTFRNVHHSNVFTTHVIWNYILAIIFCNVYSMPQGFAISWQDAFSYFIFCFLEKMSANLTVEI